MIDGVPPLLCGGTVWWASTTISAKQLTADTGADEPSAAVICNDIRRTHWREDECEVYGAIILAIF